MGKGFHVSSGNSDFPEGWTSAASGEALEPIEKDQLVLHTSYGDYSQPVTILPNPVSLPNGVKGLNRIAFSPDNSWVAFSSRVSPYIDIYKRNGDTLSRVTYSGPTPPSGSNDLFIHPKGQYIISRISETPFIFTLENTSSDNEIFAQSNLIDTQATAMAGMCMDTEGKYLLLATLASPWVRLNLFDGARYTFHSTMGDYPDGRVYAMKFDPSGQYLVLSTKSSITNKMEAILYKIYGGTFQKVQTFCTDAPTAGQALAWDSTGKYLAIGVNASPFFNIYKREGDNMVDITSGVSGTILSSANDMAFDPTGNFLAVAHGGLPMVTLFKRDGDNFTKIDTLGNISPTTGSAYCVAFSQTGEHLLCGHNQGLTIYKANMRDVVIPYAPNSNHAMSWTSGGKIGIAKNAGTQGDSVRVNILNEFNKVV